MVLAANYPSWLSPEIIPGLPFRWYGLMYLVAFGIAYLLYRRQVRERNFPLSDDDLSKLFIWGIAGLMLGARIFATLVYETGDLYRRQPWLIFWPFRDGKFTGLQGMSYHGGVIGGIAGLTLFALIKKRPVLEIGDMFAASIPLGYTFGRLGNFINGELYGRITTGPLGMIFPHAQRFSVQEAWVREAAEKTGVPIPGPDALVNLPRHPSQLYEALGEGVLLWAVIWLLRNRKPFTGFLWGLYIGGYGLIRFALEYFREPDQDLGYRIELVKNGIPPALFSSVFNLTTGQVFNLGMMLFAAVFMIAAARLPNHEPIRLYPDSAVENALGIAPERLMEQREAARRNRRKLRKKLR